MTTHGRFPPQGEYITCAECGDRGVHGKYHYPGDDPENGPRHRVVTADELRSRLTEAVGRASAPDDLAVDILFAASTETLSQQQAHVLLRRLAARCGVPYETLKHRAEACVYAPDLPPRWTRKTKHYTGNAQGSARAYYAARHTARHARRSR